MELAGQGGPGAEAGAGEGLGNKEGAGAGDDRPSTALAAERRRAGGRGGRLQRRPGARSHLRPGFWKPKGRAGGFNASDYRLTRRAAVASIRQDGPGRSLAQQCAIVMAAPDCRGPAPAQRTVRVVASETQACFGQSVAQQSAPSNH